MTVESLRCLSCGGEPHGGAPCPPRRSPARDDVVNPTCNCLPSAPDGWLACAHCGLPQAPGKAFCGFCGNRWQGDDPG
jgi:hypothetical protein